MVRKHITLTEELSLKTARAQAQCSEELFQMMSTLPTQRESEINEPSTSPAVKGLPVSSAAL